MKLSATLILAFKSQDSTYDFEYNFDHQAAAWTDSDLFAIAQVRNPNLEAVPTRTWIVVYSQRRVLGHVFYLDFIVDTHLDWLSSAATGLVELLSRTPEECLELETEKKMRGLSAPRKTAVS